MKKFLSILLAMVLVVMAMTGCVQKVENPAGNNNAPVGTSGKTTSWGAVKEKGYFVVGLDATFAPMGFTDENGEIVGFDIDLAKAAAAKMGVEVKFQPIDWDSKSMELASGNIDVIWNGFSITEERKKEVYFTDAYLTTGQVIVVPAGSSIKTKADLAGKKVALQDGSTSEEALKADTATYSSIGDANISRFKENTLVLMEVEAGRADAAVIDEIFVRYYLAKEGMSDKFVVLDEQLDPEDYGVGGRLDDKSFVKALDAAIEDCIEDGTAGEISVKWFGVDKYAK
ncbi:MAG: amino acid ABC transporter substrate-binding protein [Clostridia bacterium]|nr:amino acid ABC transporter substrate-binding protein [Clostridia bacterium]